MRAAMVHVYGGPELVTVEDVEPPPITPSGVRVAINAASINFPDLLMLADRYQVTIPLPYTPGAEFCGSVLEVGAEVSTVRPGDSVIGMATHGAFAEQVVLDAHRIYRIPSDVDRQQAASFAVTYFTAYHALHTMGRVKPGDWVVVLGAAGGVGLAAVDIAILLGAQVLAAANGAKRVAFLRERGAAAVCDYGAEDFKAVVKEVTGGAQVVVDPVGGPFAEMALRAMAWGGRYVVVGFASGEIPRIPLNLVLLKGVVLTGFENRTITDCLPEVASAHRREVLKLFAQGRITPHIHAAYPLEQISQALGEVAGRQVIGKVVIDITSH